MTPSPRCVNGPEGCAAIFVPQAEGENAAVTASAYLITRVQAAGQSTVANALAERFTRSGHVHGGPYAADGLHPTGGVAGSGDPVGTQ